MPDIATKVADLIRSAQFRTADKGYSSMDVHRLLTDVRAAAEAGEPLSPVIDARQLTMTSYGYDTERVTAVLDALRALDAPEAAETERAGSAASAATGVTEDAGGPGLSGSHPSPPVIVGPRTDPHSEPRPQPAVSSSPPPSPPAQKLFAPNSISALLEAAQFPMGSPGGSAYQAESVDSFLDRLIAVNDNGTPLGALLHQAQFPLETRPELGYDARAVDEFLDQLEALRGGSSAHVDWEPPKSQNRALTIGRTIGWVVLIVVVLMTLAIVIG